MNHFSHFVTDSSYELYEILYGIFMVLKRTTVTTLREIAYVMFSLKRG